MAIMPLTQAAIQRLAALLSQPQQGPQPYQYPGAPKPLPGLGSQVRTAGQLRDAVPPAPEQGPVPNFSPPAAATGAAPAISPEGMVNQSPPMPNPPLAEPPPAIARTDFGSALPGGVNSGPGIMNMAQPADFGALAAPQAAGAATGDETVRQTLARVMKPKLPQPEWVRNFGNLSDQTRG